ncbi:hypothetical protein HYC85_028998 [Camellia sinensis]|uniref:Uncharacterized protein n=1 Tax=Camellia sinensis TaxID=4442 RepID=A0A7J7FXF6_CAMSI|nr:hypothetical protein HYC85_028998 [Camellia sinensis]
MGRIQALGRPNLLNPSSKEPNKQIGQPVKPNYIINNPPKSSSTWAQLAVKRPV